MRVLVAGDFCPRDRVSEIVKKRDFEYLFSEVCPVVAKSDYAIVNFECPVVIGEAEPIEKKGPNLYCSTQAVDALKYAGFSCVTLANNHFLDYGAKGVEDTIHTLSEKGIDYVGGGRNIEEAEKILYKNINGSILAIINCCEHEFSIATNSTAGSNPLNSIKLYYAIKEAKENADRVLVIVHGGHEHFQLPSLRMVETYRFFIDAGADAVVNHHQHCFSGYEIYKGNPIVYGVGNFLFDIKPIRVETPWNYGYMVTIDFSSENTSIILHPYRQCSLLPRIEMLKNDEIKPQIDEINSVITDEVKLNKVVGDYYTKSASGYGDIFEPIQCRYYLAAKHRKLLPSFIGRKKRLKIADYVLCESHRDKLMWWIMNGK